MCEPRSATTPFWASSVIPRASSKLALLTLPTPALPAKMATTTRMPIDTTQSARVTAPPCRHMTPSRSKTRT